MGIGSCGVQGRGGRREPEGDQPRPAGQRLCVASEQEGALPLAPELQVSPMVRTHNATLAEELNGIRIGGVGEEEQTISFSLLFCRAALGSRPEMQLLKVFSPCSVWACYPEVGATSDGHMEHIYGKSGQLWQDFRHMNIFLLIVPSLSTLGKNAPYRERLICR